MRGGGKVTEDHKNWWAVTIIIVLSSLTSPVCAAQGPFPATNTLPINRLFLSSLFETPEVLSFGSAQANISVDYGSVFVNDRSDSWDALVDMEFAVVSFWFKIGLPLDTEGALFIPLHYYYDGFMDSFLEWYHDRLGVGNYGREARPHNEFAYRVTENGQDWICSGKGESSGIGDVSLSLKKSLLTNGDTRLSVKGTLKLPTADADSGLGSGGYDVGIMLLFGQRFDRLWLYLGLARNWLGTPETCDDFNPEISDTISGAFAAEYLWSDRLSLLGQVEGGSTPFSDTGIKALDRDFFALTLGAKYRLSHAVGVQFAFSEDLSPAASDFTVRAGLVIDF